MSRIRGKDTAPEVRLRRALWIKGLRYRIHYKVPGRPDIAFPAIKVALFVDGCFWHGCPIHSVRPKTNARFWKEKLAANRARDQKVNTELAARGWRVIRVWEHDVDSGLEAVVRSVLKAVKGSA